MEFMLDTANIADIKKFADMLPIAGVTSNPSIVKKEGKIDFFQHMKDIRGIIETIVRCTYKSLQQTMRASSKTLKQS